MTRSYESYKEVFEDYHGVLTPSTAGVAPKGLKSTGSPEFCTIWTYMGLPAISIPLLKGENNLPLGIQLVGNKLDDLRFLGVASWMEKNLKKWMRTEKRKAAIAPLGSALSLLGARAEVRYQPKGVVGAISPWNFPMNLALAPLAGLISAGNRVML